MSKWKVIRRDVVVEVDQAAFRKWVTRTWPKYRRLNEIHGHPKIKKVALTFQPLEKVPFVIEYHDHHGRHAGWGPKFDTHRYDTAELMYLRHIAELRLEADDAKGKVVGRLNLDAYFNDPVVGQSA